MIKLKRAYEPASRTDGKRFLVERLWPRGVKKSSLPLAGWLKEVAPSTGLRKWFNHDPAKWNEFRKRYFVELNDHDETVQQLLQAARQGTITLIYSSHDEQHNNAAALQEYLGSRGTRHHGARTRPAA
jgi:uncharacterized protein YeaO (DUF488 family)